MPSPPSLGCPCICIRFASTSFSISARLLVWVITYCCDVTAPPILRASSASTACCMFCSSSVVSLFTNTGSFSIRLLSSNRLSLIILELLCRRLSSSWLVTKAGLAVDVRFTDAIRSSWSNERRMRLLRIWRVARISISTCSISMPPAFLRSDCAISSIFLAALLCDLPALPFCFWPSWSSLCCISFFASSPFCCSSSSASFCLVSLASFSASFRSSFIALSSWSFRSFCSLARASLSFFAFSVSLSSARSFLARSSILPAISSMCICISSFFIRSCMRCMSILKSLLSSAIFCMASTAWFLFSFCIRSCSFFN